MSEVEAQVEPGGVHDQAPVGVQPGVAGGVWTVDDSHPGVDREPVHLVVVPVRA